MTRSLCNFLFIVNINLVYMADMYSLFILILSHCIFDRGIDNSTHLYLVESKRGKMYLQFIMLKIYLQFFFYYFYNFLLLALAFKKRTCHFCTPNREQRH